MERSARALRMLLCAGALLAPAAITGTANAEASPHRYGGHHAHGHTGHSNRYAGTFWIDGRRYYYRCADDLLYQIAHTVRRFGYYTSIDNGCLTIRARRGCALPRISWTADLHRGAVSYRGDCVTFSITTETYYAPAPRYTPTYRYYDRDRRHSDRDRHYSDRNRRYYRRDRPSRRYYPRRRPNRSRRCW